MSIRRLAGSRRNKHLPIARTTRPSDRRPPRIRNHWLFAGSTGSLYTASARAECFCGVTYSGFNRFSEASSALDHHIAVARNGGYPQHAGRAVDIHAIWPPLTLDDSTAKQRKAAEAGARGKSTAPMSTGRRIAAYERQNGFIADPDHDGPHGRPLTARQWRQAQRMEFRAA